MANSPSILLVEDQKLLRLGLRVSLEKTGCYQVLGEVGDGESAVREAQRLHPDIVIMDVGLPGIDGIEATWQIKQVEPRTHVIMFTSQNSQSAITAALSAGADGYCTKDTPLEQIPSAIDTVLRGEVWLDPMVADAVVNYHGNEKEKGITPLSDMEKQVLALIKQGLQNHLIAARLKTTTEMVARVMNNIIHQFVQKSVNQDVTVQISEGSSKSWLTEFAENITAGKVFADKYKIESLLGYGGIGAVYKAKHIYMDRYVALKVLRPELTEDRLAVRNFQLEARAIANVQHKNIVAVHDFGISQKREPYLIMEYIDGTNLADILDKQKRLQTNRFLSICLQACDGLIEAHSNGIIHCDLKPSNILIVGSYPDEQVKLVDFGLAQILSHAPDGDSGKSEKIFVSGTPRYMSPEQCMGRNLDKRSDIYSLACVMYEALTGFSAFQGKNAMESFAKQCNYIPPPMSSIYPEGQFSPRLEKCVARMLAKDPDDRLGSMEEVRAILSSELVSVIDL